MRKGIKLSTYAKNKNITYRTAHNYWKQGLLEGEQLPTGTIIIYEETEVSPQSKEYSIYCRVSSHDQKRDLERQVERMKNFAINNGYIIKNIYKEVGSGLNDKRPKLKKLLQESTSIIVEHKDRLTRFGFEYIETLLSDRNRTIIVVNKAEEDKEDLVQDFISVITSFCARIYGQRRSKRKSQALIKELTE